MNDKTTSLHANVDQHEIDKFESVASRWWDLEGEFKPLHRINPLRLNYIQERADGLFGKKSSMLAVVAVFYLKVWRVSVPKLLALIWAQSHYKLHACTH